MLGTVALDELLLPGAVLDEPLYYTPQHIWAMVKFKWHDFTSIYLHEASEGEWETSIVSVETRMGTRQGRGHLCEQMMQFWERVVFLPHAIVSKLMVSWKKCRNEMGEWRGDVVTDMVVRPSTVKRQCVFFLTFRCKETVG